MGSPLMVVAPPRLDGPAGIGQPEEPVAVEALIAQPPVEALDERVLDGLARRDEAQADATGIRPLVERFPG